MYFCISLTILVEHSSSLILIPTLDLIKIHGYFINPVEILSTNHI